MVDLVVPAGTTLTIDQNYVVAPRYGLFGMEAGARIAVAVDVVIRADQAQFAANCVIDARGAPGVNAANGPNGSANDLNGGVGGTGGPGQKGRNVAISAALAAVGSLTVVTDGGAGGQGGAGGAGVISSGSGGLGGPGGPGGAGGDAGQIALAWVQAAMGLPTTSGTAPNGHVYSSKGGVGGNGGAGGLGGLTDGFIHLANGLLGPAGASGETLAPQVAWSADLAHLLWAQAQDMGPAPRVGHGLAFDPARGRLVLFGGRVAGNPVGDTWEWDGKLWSQVADTGPSPRAFHGMAHDPAGGHVLVFGGSSAKADVNAGAVQYLSDTWGWDGEAWIQLADTGPSSRQAPAMAADPARQRVVLFSGGQVGVRAASDTWEWDGAAWTQVADTGPAPRFGAGLAWDGGAAGLLLFGGLGEAAMADTWVWSGQNWTQVADTGPGPRSDLAMTSTDQAVFLFGGLPIGVDNTVGGASVGDTWAWQNGAWRQIQDMGPAPRYDHAMACVTDAAGDHVTLFGGAGAAYFGDTWRLVERFLSQSGSKAP